MLTKLSWKKLKSKELIKYRDLLKNPGPYGKLVVNNVIDFGETHVIEPLHRLLIVPLFRLEIRPRTEEIFSFHRVISALCFYVF